MQTAFEREYEGIQWIWRVIIGFALIAAAQNAYQGFVEPLVLGAFGHHRPIDAVTGTLFFVLFVPCHLLAVIGGNRYIHLKQRLGDQSDDRLIDLTVMILQGMCFIFLARALPTPIAFLCVFACLQLLSIIEWALVARHSKLRAAIRHVARLSLLLFGFLAVATARISGLLDDGAFIAASTAIFGLALLLEIHWTMRRFFPRAMALTANVEKKRHT